MAVRAKAARSGIYQYLGREVDPSGEHFQATDTVRVYRSADEVFSPDSVRSFLMRPVTDGHPAEPVTADNWSSKAKGVIAGAMRDGEYLAFDLVLMDAGMISDVQHGKRQLSNGYATEIVFGDGVTPAGEKYDAVQKTIRGNHVAVVDAARAGAECRIADSVALCDNMPANLFAGLTSGASRPMKTIIFDGISIEVTDQAEQAITKLQGQVTKLIADAATATAAHASAIAAKDAELAKKDGEIDGLKAKVLDAAALDAAVKERADLIAKAKTIHDADYSGKSATDIRKAAIAAKGIALDGKSDAYIEARFDALVDAAPDAMRDAIARASGNQVAGVTPTSIADMQRKAEEAFVKQRQELANAYKGAPAASAVTH